MAGGLYGILQALRVVWYAHTSALSNAPLCIDWTFTGNVCFCLLSKVNFYYFCLFNVGGSSIPQPMRESVFPSAVWILVINSDHQSWRRVPLPTEPSTCPLPTYSLKLSSHWIGQIQQHFSGLTGHHVTPVVEHIHLLSHRLRALCLPLASLSLLISSSCNLRAYAGLLLSSGFCREVCVCVHTYMHVHSCMCECVCACVCSCAHGGPLP